RRKCLPSPTGQLRERALSVHGPVCGGGRGFRRYSGLRIRVAIRAPRITIKPFRLFRPSSRGERSVINILGSPRRLCDGVSRREFLKLGGLGAFGYGLAEHLAYATPQPAAAGPAATSQFGKAKACILIFLYGSPAQHETFDPKPDAVAEVRGEIGSTATAVPG